MATPPKKKQVLLSWSGGKDSAMTLHRLLQQQPHADQYEVVGLLTTVTVPTTDEGEDENERISSHHVRLQLIQAQVAALATAPMPLLEAKVSLHPKNGEYEQAIFTALREAVALFPSLAAVAFGDLFLSDIKAYREGLLARFTDKRLEALFPLWGEETSALAHRCVDLGFRARLVCVDTTQLDARFAGREFDAELLAEIAALENADPCLENGEAHTFVYAGPIFEGPLSVRATGVVSRPGDGRFAYCDLVLIDRGSS